MEEGFETLETRGSCLPTADRSDDFGLTFHGKTTARVTWEALTRGLREMVADVLVDLCHMLQQEHCVKKGDVQAQFTQFRTTLKKLATMDQTPSEDDFYLIILGSLPSSYDPHTSAISAASSIVGKTLSPDALIHAVTDESDRRISRAKQEENDVYYSNDLLIR